LTSVGIIDSQSVRTTGVGVRGYDGAKHVNGRKRHILLDSQGLLPRARAHTGDIQDRAAMRQFLEGVAEHFPGVEHGVGWIRATREVSWIEEHLGWRVGFE
jgi:putative transposase